MALKPGEAEVSLLFEQLFELESNLNAWLRAHLQQHYASTSENETENILLIFPSSQRNRSTRCVKTVDSIAERARVALVPRERRKKWIFKPAAVVRQPTATQQCSSASTYCKKWWQLLCQVTSTLSHLCKQRQSTLRHAQAPHTYMG